MTTPPKRRSATSRRLAKEGPQYRISIANASAHLFAVELLITHPAPEGQVVSLPVWIPGSYMVREFARHILDIKGYRRAGRQDREVPLTQIDKATWRAAPCPGALRLAYLVYGYDLSVRAAHLDSEHAFFNGSSVFLAVHGQDALPHQVEIVAPKGRASSAWRVATTLSAQATDASGFGTYLAKDYDELIDHPVEIGAFISITFSACATPHEIVISGMVPNLDRKRLSSDLKRICESQIRLFEPESKRAPFKRYAFLTTAVGEGYGGLEHRSSTALLCSRDDLPRLHQTTREDGYRGFLGLVSHEYFHSWHVKRIKPQAFIPYRLDRENYTRLLWIFEGFTSYYDDLVLARTGLLSEVQYLATLSKTIADVHRGVGRLRQSVASSSFEAWTKYYRQDENAPNAIVSYYKKGSLIALALDLTLRHATRGKRSLDHVMRQLWRTYGASFERAQIPRGLGEDEFPAVVYEATGVDVAAQIDAWAYGTADLPYETLFQPFGMQLIWERHSPHAALGARCAADPLGCRIMHAYEGEAAQHAGLSAHDVIVAIGGLRVTYGTLSKVLRRYASGDTVQVHAFRRDQLLAFDVRFAPEPASACHLEIERKNRLRTAWLQDAA